MSVNDVEMGKPFSCNEAQNKCFYELIERYMQFMDAYKERE